jgi:UDP-N-acetylglucosamine 2-epimerase
MQDLAARVSVEVRGADALTATGLGLKPGRYLFATIHRAENRAPDAIAAWAALLATVARPDRPVVLALHPGTRVALAASGASLPGHVRVVDPQGYRTTLTLQLHAAAVLTDSGGVQREAAWLGVPCLVLRGTTEWVEAVAESGGRMVVVGLDAARAVAELGRLAPPDRSAALAAERAASLRVEPAGAATAIVAALEDGP